MTAVHNDPLVIVTCLDCGQQATVLQSGADVVLGRWLRDHDARDTQTREAATRSAT